ncbi:MAG: thioredoxin family protein [Verrucomicrobia bacterium]|nr:thioredoxin family protein [Verrucomicrobiota bacterium]MBU4290142.1 thioredoxin family protein [Verrucomicrobiota bacterium]MBU4429387.1 thioredoxin family protein [Verrucomicrobiota bacterium]MCG2681454.1 thioredoxin family protein [Kiritimatiellia bacterium]
MIKTWVVPMALTTGVIGAFAAVNDDSAFKVSASLDESSATSLILNVSVTVAPDYWLYADQFGVQARLPVQLSLLESPAPELKRDALSGEIQAVFQKDFRVRYRVTQADDAPVSITVRYQGCRQDVCLLPEEKPFVLKREQSVSPAGSMKSDVQMSGKRPDAAPAVTNFTIIATKVGYVRAADFIAFLHAAQKGSSPLLSTWKGGIPGLTGISLIVILLGGLALNLTPCVLPMIPINLAIIGAGAQAGDRHRLRGLFIGSLYGAGMAMAYGIAGGIVVATGLKFGALNASPWFNLAVTVVFIVLALAMFDVYFLDFTRFQGQAIKTGRSVWIVPVMGAVSALLAGACVAPVVLSVLLLATDLMAKGNQLAVFLPLILGIGMGLPWPLAGAGLSLLPKAGKWMIHVKHGFGILILGMAAYYAVMGIRLWMRPAPVQVAEGWLASIPEALAMARQESKPVLIDFWASWCKSCEAMDATTLRDEKVRDVLRGFIKVKYRANHPNQSPDREMLDRFGVVGLPTYVVLKPKSALPSVPPP